MDDEPGVADAAEHEAALDDDPDRDLVDVVRHAGQVDLRALVGLGQAEAVLLVAGQPDDTVLRGGVLEVDHLADLVVGREAENQVAVGVAVPRQDGGGTLDAAEVEELSAGELLETH